MCVLDVIMRMDNEDRVALHNKNGSICVAHGTVKQLKERKEFHRRKVEKIKSGQPLVIRMMD